jgi:sucrose-6F-phosphate phosphohydrolase
MQGQPKVLATDLDGTLLPLEGNHQNIIDLRTLSNELQRLDMQLAFATGRHFESVQAARVTFDLPTPDWIICDVGTSIYKRTSSGEYELSESFADYLQQVTQGFSTEQLHRTLSVVDGLRRQEEEKQTRFKLSYYADRNKMAEDVAEINRLLTEHAIPYSVVASVDPFTGDGLVDLLPLNSSKAHALDWWSNDEGFEHQHVLYAGDSGNDSAAFAAGYRSIIVDNAAEQVLEEARSAHIAAGWRDRIFAATEPATSGVLQGVRHFAK